MFHWNFFFKYNIVTFFQYMVVFESGEVKIRTNEEISEEFALRYLQHFTKFQISKTVNLYLSEDLPLQVE